RPADSVSMLSSAVAMSSSVDRSTPPAVMPDFTRMSATLVSSLIDRLAHRFRERLRGTCRKRRAPFNRQDASRARRRRQLGHALVVIDLAEIPVIVSAWRGDELDAPLEMQRTPWP